MRSRLAAIATLSVLLASWAAPAVLCAGLAQSAADRMACCERDASCPMHRPAVTTGHSSHGMTQTEADVCCAASERHAAAAIASSLLVKTAPALIIVANVPSDVALPTAPRWFAGPAFVHPPLEALHVLLSVFRV